MKDLSRFLEEKGKAVQNLLRLKLPSLSASDADDILAEATARLWRHRDEYSSKKPLFPLLYTIARRIAIDRIREADRESETRENLIHGFRLVEHQGKEATKDVSPQLRDLLDALEQLSELDQRILRASVMHPNSRNWAQDLSKELGVRPGLLRVRRLRAIENLKRRMARLGYSLPEIES